GRRRLLVEQKVILEAIVCRPDDQVAASDQGTTMDDISIGVLCAGGGCALQRERDRLARFELERARTIGANRKRNITPSSADAKMSADGYAVGVRSIGIGIADDRSYVRDGSEWTILGAPGPYRRG